MNEPESITAVGRIPPQHLEAEQSVLGAVLLDNEVGIEVLRSLPVEDFYFTNHRTIATAMLALAKANKPIDLLTVTDRLKASGDLEHVEASYVASLSNIVPSTANAEHYAAIVREKALLRRIVKAANDVLNAAHEPGADSGELLAALGTASNDERAGYRNAFRPAREAAKQLCAELEEMTRTKVARSFDTGVRVLDENLWVRQTDLFVIAGRPGTGKTHVGIQIAKSIAKSGRGVGYASGEMPDVDLIARAAKSEAVLDAEVFRRPTTPERAWKAAEAVERVGKMPLWFTSENRHDEILRSARQLARKGLIVALVVDMLQRLRLPSGAKRTDELLGDLVRDFKNFALRERVPVFMVSSMNRGASDDDTTQPTMRSLRGSGEIESEADTVLLLHRKDTLTEWIFAKAREGCAGLDRGKVEMKRDFARGGFTEWDDAGSETGNGRWAARGGV